MISAQQTGVSIAPAIRFALRDSSERWLHFSIVGADGALVLQHNRDYRWLGTAAQLATVYERYPATRNLQAVKITPAMLASAR